MARLPRLDAAGHTHLVIQRVHPARLLCHDDSDRTHLLDTLRLAAAEHAVLLHAFGLDDDELRLLATPGGPGALGRFMQALGRRYVSACNRRHGLSGTLWDGRFRAAVVEPGPWRLDALLAVESASAASDRLAALGPDAQAADSVGGFSRSTPSTSSAAARTGSAARPAWLLDPPELWGLGNTPFEREAAWRERLARGLAPARAQALRQAAIGSWVAGSAAFAAELAQQLGRVTRPRPQGRTRQVQHAATR